LQSSALSGGTAQWYDLSLAAHCKWPMELLMRMGATLRFNSMNEKGNGGGGNGTWDWWTTWLRVCQSCLASSATNDSESRVQIGWRLLAALLRRIVVCRIDEVDRLISSLMAIFAAAKPTTVAGQQGSRCFGFNTTTQTYCPTVQHRHRSLTMVDFNSVYFSNACSELSRPLPDSLKPPNGKFMLSVSS
jgi:hypothetical protein